VLSGKVPLTEAHIESMYHQYQIEYKPEARPSAYYKDVSNAARKEIFAAKLRDIIQHNSNPSLNWQKRLNEYSDMSDLEFTNYFNIVGMPSNAQPPMSQLRNLCLLK
jgi:hypothetical protein